MQYILICLVAFVASGLTLFSGFGLGMLLTPVFSFYFPIEIAVALTAIVHFLNNVFKFFLFGKKADKSTVLRFGFPSVLAAIMGAWCLQYLSADKQVVKTILGSILIFFAFFEIVPFLAKLSFDKKYLPIGGLLSGFFGGLAGTQGALRSAFLIRLGLEKSVFIATGVVIACMIDISRMSVYYQYFTNRGVDYSLVVATTFSAFLGAYLGAKWIEKVTIKALQYLIAAMLIVFGIGLIMGWV